MIREFRYQIGEQIHTVTVEAQGDRFLVRVGDAVMTLTARAGAGGRLDLLDIPDKLEVPGRAVEAQQLRAYVAAAAGKTYVALGGETYTLRTPDAQRRRAGSTAVGGGVLTAAMPGRVLDVLVKAGDEVAKGDTLVLLEAMKMELRINAPGDGRVTRVACTAGQVVERDQVLVELETGSVNA